MIKPGFKRHVPTRMYRIIRVFVRVVALLVLLLVGAFLVLRIHGVPGFLLTALKHRVNAAGFPVDVDHIKLTLRGWQIDNFRYYSKHPDDLSPLLTCDEVLCSFHKTSPLEEEKAWHVEVEAKGVDVSPSVEWGVEIPQDSSSRYLKRLDITLSLQRDRILFSNGEIDWLGSRFNVTGTLLTDTVAEPVDPDLPPIKLSITEQQYRTIESRLEMLTLPNGAVVDIDFTIDPKNPSVNHVDFAARATEISLGDVAFSKAGIAGAYTPLMIRLDKAALNMEHQSIQLTGDYSLKSKEISGTLRNTITSPRLLQLLPLTVQDKIQKFEVRLDTLPQGRLSFGPSTLKNFANQLSGRFSMDEAAYMGVEVDGLSGEVNCSGSRVEINNLQGNILGQEEHAEENGSALHGGPFNGDVFWDGGSREFGVSFDINFDPNQLVHSLASVRIATNIIQRFKFAGAPPSGHLDLGANVDNWQTFHLKIQADANDVFLQDVELSSYSVTAVYTNKILQLDPVMAMQESDIINGSAELNFHNKTVRFDARSSMSPEALEKIIYPGLHVFGDYLKTGEAVDIDAQGTFDWGTMKQTAFTADVKTDRLDVPWLTMESFQAKVEGNGPRITIKDAQCIIYEGQGEGDFTLWWDPAKKGELPYETHLKLSSVDFRKFHEGIFRRQESSLSGTLEGNIFIQADIKTNFFAVADGSGWVSVKKGQLANLPLFHSFTKVIRIVFPGFKVFSITSFSGNFTLNDGVFDSQNAYFGGDILSAKGKGSYSVETGYDASVQVQLLRASLVSKVIHLVTDPFFKIFEIKLEGPFTEPNWRLGNFSRSPSKAKSGKKKK